MSYSIDLRKKVVEFIENGGSISEAAHRFGVTRQTIYEWLKKKRETGSLKDPPPKRPWRKLNPMVLKEFVKNQPDLTLAEYAKHFSSIPSTICEAFKRLGITRKKRLYDIKKEMRHKDKYFSKS